MGRKNCHVTSVKFKFLVKRLFRANSSPAHCGFVQENEAITVKSTCTMMVKDFYHGTSSAADNRRVLTRNSIFLGSGT